MLVIASSLEAGSRVLRTAAEGRPAAFGWQRATISELAGRLAAAPLAASGRVQVARVVLEAVCARMVHRLREEGALGRYAPIGERPGLPRALARTFLELSLAGVSPDALASDLSRLFGAYRRELAESGLADRADVLAAACARVLDPAPHPLLDLPMIVLDVALPSALDAELLCALARRSSMKAVLPSGDRTAARRLAPALGEATAHERSTPSCALDRVATQLFSDVVHVAALDTSVELFSAPGESRECVEIARRVLACARERVPFDRMAVLTHAPDRYRAHLEEALARAGVPTYFSRGTVRPDNAGRALLALLACKEEDSSARAFAEYLSLGVVPDARDGAPPEASGDVPWVAPDDELLASAQHEEPPDVDPEATSYDPDAPVVRGTLRAPWRWERLLVDAAVIGGRDRWQRRLAGLDASLESSIRTLEDPDDPLRGALERRRRDLTHLADFALPLLEELDSLPMQASWNDWTARLCALAERAIRHPARVLAVLRELAPMGPIAKVGLTEVTLVLSRRLTEMIAPPSGSPAGKLYVASIEEARGLSFDVVFVPGLAEKVFPKKVIEDPIALDSVREALGSELATTETRVEQERLALRLAVGAARERLIVSYPRLDTERGRPRVPSFYALELLRAIEGRLPSFEELASRAESASGARMAWPAPERIDDAIDGAEYDLAVLHEVLHERSFEEARGSARYLLGTNPHLARALRTRFLRWEAKWSRADGLVHPSEEAKAFLRAHHPCARAYSPTALEHLAACPYRFYLRSILKLAPREVPAALEELEPRARGSFIHEAQATILSRLRSGNLLPLDGERLAQARSIATEVVRELDVRYAERLAPAIERVWRDAIEEIDADLAEWLARMAEHANVLPIAFELAFGLDRSEGSDAASVPEPVSLAEGLILRGAIDLVEERSGALVATDHKTGAANASPALIAGGRVLQPVLYARVLEELFRERRVLGGRLYYCTSRGRFEERFVPLNDAAREAVRLVAKTLAHHVDDAFFPAAPTEHECARCDYRAVCGPAEERRVRRKQKNRLGPLTLLRKQP